MNKRLKTLVVDDEELARKDLRAVLSNFNNLEVIGEAASISEAEEFILNNSLDIIFLDIQLQGENGFDLLPKIGKDINIIFVTAFDKYAIRAFEVNAIDYLLKPVNPDRLKLSLERIEEKSSSEDMKYEKLNYEDSIFLQFQNHYTFIKISSISSITSAGDYSEIITSSNQKGLTTKSLKEWEARLPERRFIRIHRTTIINTDFIDKIEDWFNYSYRVFMKNNTKPFVMSRRFAMKLKDRM